MHLLFCRNLFCDCRIHYVEIVHLLWPLEMRDYTFLVTSCGSRLLIHENSMHTLEKPEGTNGDLALRGLNLHWSRWCAGRNRQLSSATSSSKRQSCLTGPNDSDVAQKECRWRCADSFSNFSNAYQHPTHSGDDELSSYKPQTVMLSGQNGRKTMSQTPNLTILRIFGSLRSWNSLHRRHNFSCTSGKKRQRTNPCVCHLGKLENSERI